MSDDVSIRKAAASEQRGLMLSFSALACALLPLSVCYGLVNVDSGEGVEQNMRLLMMIYASVFLGGASFILAVVGISSCGISALCDRTYARKIKPGVIAGFLVSLMVLVCLLTGMIIVCCRNAGGGV